MDLIEKIQFWNNEIERAEQHQFYFDTHSMREVVNAVEELAKIAERYERALKFYANENSYITNIRGIFDIEATVMIDNGDMAREALK